MITLNKATEGHNKSWCRAIGCAPYEMEGESLKFKIDKEYKAAYEVNQEQIIDSAREVLAKYRKVYNGENQKDLEKFEIGTPVWYADFSKGKPKLSANWDRKAVVIEKGVNSYKLKDDEGFEWVANQREVQRHF